MTTRMFSTLFRCKKAPLSASLLLGAAFSVSSCASIPETTAQSAISNSPKNIILFVGDGMGVSTVTAARIFDGQDKGLSGEEHYLSFEAFPQAALIKTYNANAQVPDSAGTATAIFSGYKANIGTLNVVPDDDFEAMAVGSCAGGEPKLMDRAKSAGKSIGVISTARLTHATPAAIYGRSLDRGWEADKDVPEELAALGCTPLAQQLVTSGLDLALGGGAKEFSEAQIAAWPGTIVRNADEMMAARNDDAPLLGLFGDSHMEFEADRAASDQPSLSDMTRTAIDRLSSDKDGYVLMVEAGRVDHAHHGSNAFRALRDMQALSAAVQTAVETAGEDTLIVVTADHSHVFVIQGYPTRGNPILGLVQGNDFDRETMTMSHPISKDEDGKPYTTLGYYNGPNAREADSAELTEDQVTAPDYRQQTAVRLSGETHGGEDVPLYATGPGSEEFGGVMDQDEIGRVIARLLGEK